MRKAKSKNTIIANSWEELKQKVSSEEYKKMIGGYVLSEHQDDSRKLYLFFDKDGYQYRAWIKLKLNKMKNGYIYEFDPGLIYIH